MNRWMQLAHDEALKGMDDNEGGPFGAAVVRGEELVCVTHNQVLATNDPTAHAEINAIRKASQILQSYDLSDCVLYTTCYPCPMCLGAILWARIPTVYYGAAETDAARGGFDDQRFHSFVQDPKKAFTLQPLDVEKTRTLFDRWLEKSDRVLY